MFSTTTLILIITAALLLLSGLLNLFLFRHLRTSSTMLMFFSENLSDLLILLDDFSGHLKSIYELETFYGDETLHSLLRHSKEIIESIEEFEEIISLSEEDEFEGDEMDEEGEEGEESEFESDRTAEKTDTE